MHVTLKESAALTFFRNVKFKQKNDIFRDYSLSSLYYYYYRVLHLGWFFGPTKWSNLSNEGQKSTKMLGKEASLWELQETCRLRERVYHIVFQITRLTVLSNCRNNL